MEIEELKNIAKKSKSLSGCVRLIKNNSELLEILIDRTKYLENNSKIIIRLYHIKNDLYKIPLCPICGKEISWNEKYSRYNNTCSRKCNHKFIILNNPEKEEERRRKISEIQHNRNSEDKKNIRDKMKKTLMERYGVDSYAKSDEFKKFMIENYGYISPFELKETQNKTKETLMERYGVNHNFKISEVIENRKQTYINNYGVDNPNKCEEIKEKSKETNLEKYGETTFSKTDKYKEIVKKTNLEKFGKESYTQTEEYKNRYKETCLKKYGVEHWMQNSDNYQKYCDSVKNNNSYKKYTLPNGNYVYLQGYEDYVLEEILLKKYDINDIIINNNEITIETGKIYYTINNKKHKYYPDFFIKNENLIIEVKSDYTYNKDLEVNKLKKESCLKNGLKYEFIVVSKKDYRKWKSLKNN